MSIENALKTALGSLVGSRVAPVVFPAPPAVPTWPAIRYTIVDTVPVQDRCGDGDDDTSVHRVQLDCVASTFAAARSLRLAVMAAMRSFPVTARLDLSGPSGYDDETKTYRESLDYLVYGLPT